MIFVELCVEINHSLRAFSSSSGGGHRVVNAGEKYDPRTLLGRTNEGSSFGAGLLVVNKVGFIPGSFTDFNSEINVF